MTVDTEVTWGDRPLEELMRLVRQRSYVLGETAKGAAIATMINVLVSLRAETSKASSRTAKLSRPSVELQRHLRASFDRLTMHPCLRHLRKGSEKVLVPHRIKWLTDGLPDSVQQVFLVHPLHSKDSSYYVVAPSVANVYRFEERRIKHNIAKAGGLARYAFSRAMKGLSTKNTISENLASYAMDAAIRLSSQKVRETADGIEVEFRDELEHAIPALNGGAAAINLAYAKAANKTWSILATYMADKGMNWFLKPVDIGSTPFPEVIRPKRRSKPA